MAEAIDICTICFKIMTDVDYECECMQLLDFEDDDSEVSDE